MPTVSNTLNREAFRPNALWSRQLVVPLVQSGTKVRAQQLDASAALTLNFPLLSLFQKETLRFNQTRHPSCRLMKPNWQENFITRAKWLAWLRSIWSSRLGLYLHSFRRESSRAPQLGCCCCCLCLYHYLYPLSFFISLPTDTVPA